MDSVQLTTEDGAVLDADLSGPLGDPVGRVVLCHPHPVYGGNRFHPIVDALFRALPDAGFVALRFDFRIPDEQHTSPARDLAAAIAHLTGGTGGTGGPPGRLAAVGYSFGAATALGAPDQSVAAVVAIAPPLAMMPKAPPAVPTFVLSPRHDQFGPPDRIEPLLADWDDVTFAVVESADHFLHGHADEVSRRVTRWLLDRRDR